MKRLTIIMIMFFISSCAQNSQHVDFVHQDTLYSNEKEKPLPGVMESPEESGKQVVLFDARDGEILKPAQLALLAEVNKHQVAGELSLAASALERVIRINPRAVTPYRLLAELSLEQGELRAAAELARKALSLISKQGHPRSLMSEKIKLMAVLATVQDG